MRKIRKPVLGLLVCQAVILLTAMILYLYNKNNLYLETISFDDLSYTPDQGAAEDTFSWPLKKGAYRVYLNYNTDTSDNTVSVSSQELGDFALRSNPLTLESSQYSAFLTMELGRSTEKLDLTVEYAGTGTLQITEMTIAQTSAPSKRGIVYGLLLCVLLAFLYYFIQTTVSNRKKILALAGIFLASSYPVFTDYLIPGHDILFHPMRVEGIYLGLLQGEFPVKIHPLWAQGYGYAVGVFYGNLFLYFPAFLRIMGFSVQAAYKAYLLAINLGTTLISYRCFRKIFASSRIGLLGSLLYTLSVYRLCDLYTRSAVGEYTALMFLPLIFYGFYLVFTDTELHNNWLHHSIIIALGLTGLIQSHVLSCEMAAVFILLTCIILIKKVIRPSVFKSLAVAAIAALFMNLGFLVPFFSYFNDVLINSSDWGSHINYSIQNRGMFPTQIFGFLQRFYGGDMTTASGTAFEPAAAPGLVLIIGMGLFLYVLCCCGQKFNDLKPPLLSFILGCLALWMSTCYFPWDTLASLSEITRRLVISLEFPWRFVCVACILLTYVSCYAVSVLKERLAPTVFPALCAALLVLLAVNCGWYYYDVCLNVETYRVYDSYELCDMAMYSCDYLPAGTDHELIRAGQINSPADCSFTDYYKNGTRIQVHVQTGAEGGSFDFPLNYYKDYKCTDTAGQTFPVSAGYNNMLRVTLPANYDGTLSIRFCEPLLWRISELVSFLTLAVALLYYLFRSRISLFHQTGSIPEAD